MRRRDPLTDTVLATVSRCAGIDERQQETSRMRADRRLEDDVPFCQGGARPIDSDVGQCARAGKSAARSHGTPKAIIEETSPDSGLATRFFYVEGCGAFPFDMLRLEHSWPARRQDAHALELKRDSPDACRIRQIMLETASPKAPSLRRWAKTGWMLLV